MGSASAEALPQSCPQTVGLPYDHGLWRGNVEYYTLQLEQVRWFPGTSDSTGYVECIATRDNLGSARPALISVFAVERPQSPAWQVAGSWLVCRPSADPVQCAFSAMPSSRKAQPQRGPAAGADFSGAR